MASKKEKRAAGQAKRRAFMESVKETGLAAQQAGREERRREQAAMVMFAEEINYRHSRLPSRDDRR